MSVARMASARVPVEEGEFTLHLYRNNRDGFDHLAFVLGDLQGQQDVLTRIHSECFTGDVLGSLRCDCGPQLHEALAMIARRGRGVVVYLRQEGRGIGLLEKLRAYNLQDQGLDTVDANLSLGHPADAREYDTAALILEDLGIRSIELVTNNPDKLESLRKLGVVVPRRLPLQVNISQESQPYMQTKILRMEHMLNLHDLRDELESWLESQPVPQDRPLVTLAFAQSLDGSIAQEAGRPSQLSGPQSQLLTHRLRRWHQAILVGIGTVLADDPQLTVRLLPGQDPRPVVLDSHLRFPSDARLLDNPIKPWILTHQAQSPRAAALMERGARLLSASANGQGKLDLAASLRQLRQEGVQRLMVEGGAQVLQALLDQQLADLAVITIAPRLLGGLPALASSQAVTLPRLVRPVWKPTGEDMVVWAGLDFSL